MNTVSNIEKIVEFVESANAGSGEELAAKIKRGGRRSGLKVVSSDEGQARLLAGRSSGSKSSAL